MLPSVMAWRKWRPSQILAFIVSVSRASLVAKCRSGLPCTVDGDVDVDRVGAEQVAEDPEAEPLTQAWPLV